MSSQVPDQGAMPPVQTIVIPETADIARFDWLAEFPPTRSLGLDQEALRIYERAYAFGVQVEKKGTPPVTFSTVLAALLVGEDETSRWFAREAQSNGPSAIEVFKDKNAKEEDVRQLAPPPGKPQPLQLSGDRHLLTVSARTVLENAERWAQGVGAGDIGVRHIVAAYVLNPPPAHREQMQRWKFQETRWRPVFFKWAAQRYTAEQWTDASLRPAPTKSFADPEQQQVKVKGSALAFPGDESTLKVLENAARYHARSKDSWLALHTVFCALVETARTDATVQDLISPIWKAITASELYVPTRDSIFVRPPATKPIPGFADLDISPRVLNALETARELALTTRSAADTDFNVGVLALAGALVANRVEGDSDLATFGVDPQTLRLELLQHAQDRDESSEVWRESLGEEQSLRVGRAVDLSSDEPEAVIRLDEAWANDPLAIRGDVETFAALLASSSLEPPLSIGLFGPWGSGKTTFLKRLERAVRLRAADAQKASESGEQTAYVSNIVHVDFNAWHFSEGALTSSLVDRILRKLSDHIRNQDQNEWLTWKQKTQDALESTKRQVEAAEARVTAANSAVTKAEESLEKSREKAASAATSLQSAVGRVWAATKNALKNSPEVKESGVLEAMGNAVSNADELRSRLNAVRTRPARLISDLGRTESLIFAGLVLAVPPIIAWLVGLLPRSGQSVQVMSSLTAALTAIGVWARKATDAVAKVDRAITQVEEKYAEQLAQDPAVKSAQQTLTEAQAAASTASAGLEAARQELARAQIEAANATLPAQMLKLASSRIDAESYSKELTTLSLARADLQALSELLREQRKEAVAARLAAAASAAAGAATEAPAANGADVAARPPARPVERIILYIDDLDRCQPKDVVRVLQLVHMLLAFELFVVVVAVDARWVEEALRRSFPWLAGSEAVTPEAVAAEEQDPIITTGPADARGIRGSTPFTAQDYLEKIFQIAFWLEPMTTERTAKYLRSLVVTAPRESGPVFSAEVTGGVPPGATPVTRVGMAGIELDQLRALARYAGTSPRRVKRLVNAYRLIKAGLTDAQLAGFLARESDDGELSSGPYQIVIALLVIATGAPAASGQILKELAEWDPRDELSTVVAQFQSRNQPEWTMAARVIDTLVRTQKEKDVKELRGWAHKVGRFQLNARLQRD